MLTPVVARAPQFANARLLLAGAYLAANSPQQAIGHLEEMRKTMPGNPNVAFRLAQAYTRVGRPREALALLDADAKRLDKVPVFHLERSRALVLLGRVDDAYRAATSAQALAPGSIPPLLLMGQIKLQQGDTKAAQELFSKAAQMDEGSVPRPARPGPAPGRGAGHGGRPRRVRHRRAGRSEVRGGGAHEGGGPHPAEPPA